MHVSNEYKNLPEVLGLLTIQADRIFLACQQHPKLSNTLSFQRKVINALSDINNLDNASDMLGDIEKWLKAIMYFSIPERFELHNNNKKRFMLSTAINELNLLEQFEMNFDSPLEIKDPIKRYIWITKENRDFETHETQIQSSFFKNNYLLCALATMFAALHKHYDRINSNLQGLFTRAVDPSVQDLCSIMKSEYQSKLKTFRGRQKEVNAIVDKLTGGLRSTGGYYLVTGIEGIGKTALCSKVSERLLSQQKNPIPIDHPQSVETPWLPSVILILGKCIQSPFDIVQCIISQINSMLLDPIALPEENSFLHNNSMLPYDSQMEEEYDINYAISGDEYAKSNQSTYSATTPMAINERMNKRMYISPAYDRAGEMNPSFSDMSSELIKYKSLLFSAIKRIVDENGPIVLIIDALDEINRNPEVFNFLPERLPIGASALLTVRPNLNIDTYIKNQSRLSVYPDNLQNLNREEIPLLTGVSDLAGPEEKKFNDDVYRKSGGWSLHVAAIAKSLEEQNGDFSSVHINNDLKSYFERQQKEWLTSYPTGSMDAELLENILTLLILFEPVAPISFETIQGYLESKLGRNINFNILNTVLAPVAYQINGLDTSKKKIKIGIKAFAEYLRDNYLGNRDLIRALQEVSKWLIEDEELESKIIADFLSYWIDGVSSTCTKIVKNIITSYKEYGKISELKVIAKEIVKEHGLVSPAYGYCIQVLSEADDVASMYMYSKLLLNESGKKVDLKKAEKWLRQAAEREFIPAMISLGSELLEGEIIEQNKKEGEEWLRRSVELEDERAYLILANRLIDGAGLDKNIEEGFEILEEAASRDYVRAMITLSNRLLDQKVGKVDPDRAKEWLLIAADDLNSKQAMYILGSRQLLGNGLPLDIIAGEEWLRKAAEENHLPAMHELGIALIKGEKLTQDQEEGMEWLEKAAEKRFVLSNLFLSKLYLTGKYVEEDREVGENWLLQATKLKSKKAMLILAEYYLYGKYNFPLNPSKAEEWYHKAIEEGSNVALHNLGIEYIKGDIIKRNVKEGKRLLQEAIKNDYIPSHYVFGMMLVEGEYKIPKMPTKGKALLEKAVEKDNSDAIFYYANLLLDGEYLTKDISRGEELLQKLIDKKDKMALINYINRLCLGQGLTKNVDKAKMLLVKYAEDKWANAMYILGYHLVKGEYFGQDLEEGFNLLHAASDLGSTEAKEFLGNSYLKGEIIDIDFQKGFHLLEEVYKLGDLEVGHNLGLEYYKIGNFEKATKYFYELFKQGVTSSAISLLYMYRRNELADSIYVNMTHVLKVLEKRKTSLGDINLALYHIGKSQEISAWREADNIVGEVTVDDIGQAVKWWGDLANINNDPEGHLVLGWLQRHGKISDPDGLTIIERYNLISNYFEIPHWLQKNVNTKNNN